MKIDNLKRKKEKIIFVHVTPDEALSLIQSLSSQLCNKNNCSGRLESYTDKGEYFSIAVDFSGVKK